MRKLIDADKFEKILVERSKRLAGVNGDLGLAVAGDLLILREQPAIETSGNCNGFGINNRGFCGVKNGIR